MMKTTIILRDDLYGLLTATFGKRNMSKTINEILFETLVKKRSKSMFGIDKGMRAFAREHKDRF